MVFPKLDEFYINLSYIIQYIVYYGYTINERGYKKKFGKELDYLVNLEIIEKYELVLYKTPKLIMCDVSFTVKSNKKYKTYEVRLDLTKNMHNGVSLLHNNNVYFFDVFCISYGKDSGLL